MAFMEGILKPCQCKVLFEREYSAEQDAMIYKCEYVMRAVAINCKSLTANQAEQMDKFAMMGIYNGGWFFFPQKKGKGGGLWVLHINRTLI